MNKILWPMVAFCMLISLYWVFTGIGPQSIPVIRPSNFNTPFEIAEYTYRQLFPRIANHQAIVFGSEGNRPEQAEIFKKFVQLLVERGKQSYIVASDTRLKDNMFDPVQVEQLYLNDIPEQHRRQKLNEVLLSGKKIIFFLSSFDAVHFRREAMVNIIEDALKLKSISFVMARLALHPDEITIANLCVPPAKDEMNYNPLACLVRTKSANLQKNKKIDKSKLIGFTEQQGQNDFMIYTWLPKN